MFWRKKSYFDNSAPDIKNRRKQPCQVRYMAPIEQFFVTLNVATPDLFARFDKRKDRQKLRQAINPSAGMLRSGLKIEDEYHFVMECKTNCDFRKTFLNKLKERNRNFAALNQREQFVYIFTNEDNMSLTWLGKFIYKSFQRRNSLLSIL